MCLNLKPPTEPGNLAADDEVSFWVAAARNPTGVLTPSSLADSVKNR